MISLLLVLALPQVPDSGVLVIRQDSTLVARESFHTSLDPTSGGWILDANVRYDRSRPVIQLVPIVQIGGDTSAVKVQFDAGDPGAPLRSSGRSAGAGSPFGTSPGTRNAPASCRIRDGR